MGRRSVDFESEIRDLKKQLDDTRNASITVATGPSSNPNQPDWIMHSGPIASTEQVFNSAFATQGVPAVAPSITEQPAFLSTASPLVATTTPTDGSQAPGLTTRPETDGDTVRQRPPFSVPRPRALGNTALSVEEIDDLFKM